MQTFLPYPDFDLSVRTLDWRRLGKQRVEAYQVLNVLTYERLGFWMSPPKSKTRIGWQNHVVARMWRGYEAALEYYMNLCIYEWIERGYKNNMKITDMYHDMENPPWLGDEKFHASHRSNLLRKDPEFYGQYGWKEPSDLPYVWPR